VPTGAARVIALDGPSGSGKSTVARAVARRLGWRYVDTGATYRAATLAVLRAGVDPADEPAVAATVAAARIELSVDPGAPTVTLDGDDVTAQIRGAAVTRHVSAVSAVPAVRASLVDLQRAAMGEDGAVVEGRDIATVVAPRAAVKVYLDASPEVRAARRASDGDPGVSAGASGSGPDVVRNVQDDLARRDALDSSRVTSPLATAPDAVRLDSSALDAAAVVERVLELAGRAGLRDGAGLQGTAGLQGSAGLQSSAGLQGSAGLHE
jgi:CMP/dCMP kinase